MEHADRHSLVLEDTTRRERAKQRLYVFFQVGGWGFFFVIQLVFGAYFSLHDGHKDLLTMAATVAMIMALGLLLTHYARPFMTRWGWKQVGWRALVPRLIGIAFLLGFLWTALGYGYSYGLVGLDWPAAKYSHTVLFFLSCLNGTIVFIGWLCLYFFYHLFDRFNRSEIERLRLTTHVKEAELRALKSQVNPHFIFNSLNSLRALIEEDPAQARAVVTQLANLLRYSLQSGQLETVPFEEELRVVSDYLALEQVRHEERLRVRLDIAPETLLLPVPPMLLQTLVENAVKYGIAVRPEGGEIAIIARREGDSLRLQVINPGEVAVGSSRSLTSTGVGLRNASERLRLLFGERAVLTLREQLPALVVAEATVPVTLSAA